MPVPANNNTKPAPASTPRSFVAAAAEAQPLGKAGVTKALVAPAPFLDVEPGGVQIPHHGTVRA